MVDAISACLALAILAFWIPEEIAYAKDVEERGGDERSPEDGGLSTRPGRL